MKFKRILGLFLGLGLLAGCSSSGNQVLRNETEGTVAMKLHEGRTTQIQVQNMFGAPMEKSFTSAGDEIWNYSFSKMRPHAMNFIPTVRVFGRVAKGEQRQLSVLFDDRGVVDKYAMTNSEVTLRTGLYK